MAALALLLATVPLGIAQAALDDIVDLATDKVPLLSPSSLAANPLFQYQLADADVKLRAAARTALRGGRKAGRWRWRAASSRPTLRAQLRSAAVLATMTAASVVDTAFRSGGGSSLYLESPLQRRMRDVASRQSALLAQARHVDHLRCRVRRAEPRPHDLLN